jgi:hypothetical protein
LVLIHRGPEYEKDLTEISHKVRAIDKDITVHALPFRSTDQLPTLAWRWPTLVSASSSTGALYVLECNPGGNIWHFSPTIGAGLRLGFGNAKVNGEERAHQIARRMLIEQYGAFDIVAKTAVEQTHRPAS